jgi:hypothetical protein
MISGQTHEICVDSWLTRAARVERAEPLRLLERAMGPLWKRASSTLGSVTLAAIARRVRMTTVAHHPTLAGLDVSEKGVSLGGIPTTDDTREDVQAGVREFLVQFLTIIGSLTAEILTPALHATLASADISGKNGNHERKGSKR